MYEMYDEVKKADERKYKYSNINLWLIPEVANNIENVSYYFIREYLRELLNNPHLILSVPLETANEFFNKHGYILKRLHSKRDLHDKWKPLSFGAKKRLYYLINQKLLEVLRDELQIEVTHPPSS
jgi:hypothetical protein